MNLFRLRNMAAPMVPTTFGRGTVRHFRSGAAISPAGAARASGMGSRGLARLHGLFAVYKPPGLKWKHVRDTVELQLLKGEPLEADPRSCSPSPGSPSPLPILPAK